jgi:phosphoserine phosphatase RsbU/P
VGLSLPESSRGILLRTGALERATSAGLVASTERSRARAGSSVGDTALTRSVPRLADAARAPSGLLETLLDRAPIGVVLIGPDLLVRGWNPATTRLLGVSEADALDRPLVEFFDEKGALSRLVERCEGELNDLVSETLQSRYGDRTLEVTARSLGGSVVDGRVMLLLQDVTERQATELERNRVLLDLAFLSEASSALAVSLDYRTALEDLARLVVGHMADLCTVHLESAGSFDLCATAHSGLEGSRLAERSADAFPTDPFVSIGADAIRRGRGVVVPEPGGSLSGSDIESSVQELLGLGVTSAMVVPLTARGRTFGLIGFASLDPERLYKDEDLALADELGRRTAIAIDNARLFADTQLAEARLRELVQSLDAILWEVDPVTLRFTFVSQRAEDILGYPVKAWLEDPDFWSSIVDEVDKDRATETFQKAGHEQRDFSIEYRARAANGDVIWLRDLGHVVRDDTGAATSIRGLMIDVTDQKRVEEELEASRARFARMAHTLQQSLLPPALPSIPGVEVAAAYRPAGEGNDVGGDFYDAFEVADQEWAILIGDVCGKGPEAASITALARYTIRALALRMRRPVRILEDLNESILKQNGSERFCAIAYARLRFHSTQTMTVTVSVAGHPRPFVLRGSGDIETIGDPGIVLGIFPKPSLKEVSFPLQSGDSIVFYTDGVADAGAPREALGEEGLRAALAKASGFSAAEIVSEMEQAVLEVSGGVPRDDCAILVVRVS